ncbi:hypothetical protein QTP70_013765 [Hemibagrus guttatus]|uniref:Uncharacterized protein n=1 Tax=Hemibagrus guttatus TaxID=175788 RepID=A0AAE0UTZ8_9TELE|nr:hypothetical protein QTP70_013765 [Hemibagrus guttatus]
MFSLCVYSHLLAHLQSSRSTNPLTEGQDDPRHSSSTGRASVDASVQVPSTAEEACQTDVTTTATHCTQAVQTRYKECDPFQQKRSDSLGLSCVFVQTLLIFRDGDS